MKSLCLLLVLNTVMAIIAPANLTEYPLCETATNEIARYSSEVDYSMKKYRYNTRKQIVLSPGKKCQIVIDGVSSDGIELFYIPSKYNNKTNPGKFLTYKWDKYELNADGECVYDYESSAGLEGFWDLNNPKGICGAVVRFIAEKCQYDCNDSVMGVSFFSYFNYRTIKN